ncbi:exonuclease domain-containing protein [Corallincola spongiicola]|uniref:Exonuclease domain-containing protein n=1 Tax=Corallincola spongiicola TaxID=2520508 RepID=A0ABY1WS24_9GAMM|nr:exonuclease domain-containing protein [Corallincola spongiicola]TAA47541.1 hypothetical protein EXY25_10010 [Corallincola spongiicola]
MTQVRPADNQQAPIIIDVEASGFGSGSYPIEIGLAMPANERHCFLIRPAEHWRHWSEEAEKIHKISRQALHEHGLEIQDVAYQLNEILAGLTVYSDAWSHDSSWVYKLFDEAEIYPKFKIETLRKLLTEKQLSLWDATREKIEQEQQTIRHRASADAHVLQLTFLRTQ